MSFITGTATNYFDLLTILRDFLVDQGHAWGLSYSGTGNGRLRGAIGKSGTVVQTITCTATSSTSFDVSGSVTGSMGTATVDTPFTHAQCDFEIEDGAVDFVAGDVFTFNLSPKWDLLRFGGCSDSALRTASVSGASAMFNDVTNANAISVASGALPIQITVQMQSAVEVKAFSVWNGTSATNVPTTYALEYSDNGSSWTTAETFSGLTWSASSQRKDHVLAASAGSHLYWRLNVTAGAATVSLGELKLFADTGFKWACSNSFQFAFRAPGVDGTKQIHVLGTLVINSGSGYYNHVYRGARFWIDQDLDIGNIPGVSSTHAHLLNNNTAQYWIVANGDRFILMTRLSGVYELTYCGFGLPYETPSNHPYPCIIGAPSNSTTRIVSNTDPDYRNPHDPGDGGMEVMIPSGLWRDVRNRSGGSGADGSAANTSYGKVWPWSESTAGQNSFILKLRDAVDGTKPLQPAAILLPQDTHPWGEFEGISWVSGFGNAAEALTQIGAIDYINFPNVYRSALNHFAAVALD